MTLKTFSSLSPLGLIVRRKLTALGLRGGGQGDAVDGVVGPPVSNSTSIVKVSCGCGFGEGGNREDGRGGSFFMRLTSEQVDVRLAL